MTLGLTIVRALYLTSLALSIIIGAFYADYLNDNEGTDRSNEISTISLIFFCVILFVVGTADILRYITSNSLVRLLPVMGLVGSYVATIAYYYQDQNEIDNGYKAYFYLLLVLVGLTILSLIILFFTDKSFKPPSGEKYTGVNTGTIALEQTSNRIRKEINKLKDKKDYETVVEDYKNLLKEIEKGKNDKNKDSLIVKSSYLYGGEQFVTNVMLSEYAGDGKYSYIEAFDKIKELKDKKDNKTKLKRPTDRAEDSYTYSDIISKFARELRLNRDLIFSSKDKCNDLLGHLPMVHKKDQKIIENSCK